MNKQSYNSISFTEAINRTNYARNEKDIIASLILEIFSDVNYIIQSIFQLKNNWNLIVEKLAENTPYYNINLVLILLCLWWKSKKNNR